MTKNDVISKKVHFHFLGEYAYSRWRKYSGLVLCKSRGNSGVTASTSRHWKLHLQCGDNSILRANVTLDSGSPCLGAMGASALLVVGLSVPVSILLRSLNMSGATLSTGSWGRYVSGDPVHDLASTRGHEWLATCVPVQDVLSQGILSSSTTCDISGCSEEALHVTANWW